MAAIRPFSYEDVRRMTRVEVALEASAVAHFGRQSLAPDLADGLAAVLEHRLGQPSKVLPPEVKVIARADVPALLPATACLVVVGASPGDRKIIVEIDLGLAALAVERLLGGSGESGRILRPLTEIEQGVLSFLLLELLARFAAGPSTGRELVLTLDRFASSAGELRPLFEADADFVLLGTRLSVGAHVGYARILLPAALVTARFDRPVPQSGAAALGRPAARALLAALADKPVVARVELAELADLTGAELRDLEPGDIIVVEGHEVTRTPEGLGGVVTLKVGAGRSGRVRCRLSPAEPQRLEVVEIVVQEHPLEDVMADEGARGAAGGETLVTGEALLRDVAAPVVVELGRVRLSAAQVVRLDLGQVLRLPRAATDPVDLVVDGKVLARGELVDVEGELGVRILQIVGAE